MLILWWENGNWKCLRINRKIKSNAMAQLCCKRASDVCRWRCRRTSFDFRRCSWYFLHFNNFGSLHSDVRNFSYFFSFLLFLFLAFMHASVCFIIGVVVVARKTDVSCFHAAPVSPVRFHWLRLQQTLVMVFRRLLNAFTVPFSYTHTYTRSVFVFLSLRDAFDV